MKQIFDYLGAEPGWLWMVVAAVLFTLDVVAPGFFMIWFAVAAVITGAIVFLVPLETVWQILIFCFASVASLGIGRALWGGSGDSDSDKPLLNQRARQLVGRTYTLATAIEGGRGRITAGDGLWTVRGPDLPQGSLVQVTGAEGTELIVLPAASKQE